jgi:hypothetical protein
LPSWGVACGAQDILEKYLASTSRAAESAIAKLENVIEKDFAKRAAKRRCSVTAVLLEG